MWCRSCCLASRESLLTTETRYYTTLTDTNSAYKVVTTPEQFQMKATSSADKSADETGEPKLDVTSNHTS